MVSDFYRECQQRSEHGSVSVWGRYGVGGCVGRPYTVRITGDNAPGSADSVGSGRSSRRVLRVVSGKPRFQAWPISVRSGSIARERTICNERQTLSGLCGAGVTTTAGAPLSRQTEWQGTKLAHDVDVTCDEVWDALVATGVRQRGS